MIYEQLGHAINGKIGDRLKEFTKSFISRLSDLGLDIDKEGVLPNIHSTTRPFLF